jgi:hypothetical protein
MSVIQARPTRYAGCHFRSRLEARWAVFFDFLGIRWVYEPEGFVGCYGMPYLPDFHLPDLYIEGNAVLSTLCNCDRSEAADSGVYVEIKPTAEALHRDGRKLGCCIDYHATPISHSGLLILGDPSDPRLGVPVYSLLKWWKGVALHRVAFHKFANSWELSYVDYSYGGIENVDGDSGIPRGSTPITTTFVEKAQWSGRSAIEQALTAARSARFEHGESGAT